MQPQQGRAEGKKSLQGPTTVDSLEEARIAHEKTMKEYYNGMRVVSLIAAIPFLTLVGLEMKWKLDRKYKKEISEPQRIEIKEQGRESHPSPVLGIPCP